MPLFTLFGLAVINLHGQQSGDSISSKVKLISFYHQAIGESQHLFNGPEYNIYDPIKDEHPYFLKNEEAIGKILYDGVWYNGIPLFFDMYRNKVVIFHNRLGIRIQLINELIDDFYIQDHRFTHVKDDPQYSAREGFYEVLYDGPMQILAYRRKRFLKEAQSTGVNCSFIESVKYYMNFDGRLFRIPSKRAALQILKDYKTELKPFIVKNKRFNKNFESFLVQLARHFEELKSP